MNARDWRHRAVCREEDPELFFPLGNTGPWQLQIEEAKAVCRRCPAMNDCRRWALDTRQDSGVWGGLSENELRAIRRKASRNRPPKPPSSGPAKCGTPAGLEQHRLHKTAVCQPCRNAAQTAA